MAFLWMGLRPLFRRFNKSKALSQVYIAVIYISALAIVGVFLLDPFVIIFTPNNPNAVMLQMGALVGSIISLIVIFRTRKAPH